MTRIKISIVIKIVALVFYFLLAFFLAKAQVTSDFSSSADGWSSIVVAASQSYVPTYNNAGGNPGGYISVDLINPTSPYYFYADRYFDAPAKFLGNKSFSYNQNLTFDLKQSLAGTDVAAAEVVISGGGVTIYFPVSSFPGTSSWTSYTVLLKETAGWKTGSLGGAATTQNEMKKALSNIASLRIRAQYFPSFPAGPYSGKLDNVVLNVMPLVQPPTITSITPQTAIAGATVTISGSNFNTTPSQNSIYFNSVKAVPSSASATQLVVTVPASAAYGQLVVENLGTGLQGISPQSFSPLFDNNKDFGGQIIPASMARGYANVLKHGAESYNGFGNMDKGDLDGDGWIDLVATEINNATIYYYRNLASGGSVSTSSFAPASSLSIASIPSGSANLGELTVADVDSDGKLDIVAISSSGGITGYLAVFRNTSTAGSISFASPLFFSYPYYSSQLSTTSGDFDGDGRIDFAYTTGTSPGGIWINQNLSTPGNVDFAYGMSVGTNLGHTDITTGDLNADGKPEIIASTGASIEIYQNTSVPGSISVNAPFTIPSAFSGAKVVAADLDADNKLDLAWSGYGAQYVYFTQNIYSGSAFDATSFGSIIQIQNTLSNPESIGVSDMNADGKVDVVMTGYSDLGIMQNVGTGSLTANSFLVPTLFQGSAGAQAIALLAPAIADLDGDNKPDVAAVYTNSAVTVPEKGIYIFHNESYPSPVIGSISPSAAIAGSTVALNGNLMSTGNTNPTARLSNIASNINGVPSNTTTSVITPAGAISGKFSLTNHGLTAYSTNFSLLFSTNRTIGASSFGPSIDFALANNLRDALGVADFDDDGKIDVAVIDNGFTNKIFKNTQVTIGQPISASSLNLQGTTYNAAYNLIALDIDGDGKIDLNSGGGLLQNTSSGSISFTSVTSTTGGFFNSSWADFNKDGKTDLVFTNGGINVQVYENLSRNGAFTPSGTFQNFGGGVINFAAPSAPGSVVAADFDGDGYDDIISMNPNTNNSTYFLNNKIYGKVTPASFSSLGNYSTSGLQPYDVTANDFDGDGKIDIAITYYNSAFVSVLLNNSVPGDISFTGTDVPVATKGYKITSQDLDGDGKAEIVVIHQPNPGPGSFTVLQNNCTTGVVSFTATNFPINRNPQAINIADINSDQKPDILIAASSGTVGNALMVFENKILTNTITITMEPADFIACVGDVATFTCAATGTTNISYQWQFSVDGIAPFADISNNANYSNATTATLSVNTAGNFGAGRYRCKISGDFASTVYTNDEGLFINSVPGAPSTQGSSGCPSSTLILTASGGSNGQYLWYTVVSGGTAIAGETNSTYTTPALAVTTIYYVSIKSGSCESPRTPVTATINTCNAPVIETQSLATIIGGQITLDLLPLITTTNLDPTSLQIITPPSSGATASIDANGILTIDYTGKSFAGLEQITIKACDLNGQCSTQNFSIEVGGDIIVYNGISPHGKNPSLIIQFIEILPETKNNTVYIFDRWQNQVWHGVNYDNTSVVFTGTSDSGADLPSGVYFYKIEFSSGHKTKTGFISLRRL